MPSLIRIQYPSVVYRVLARGRGRTGRKILILLAFLLGALSGNGAAPPSGGAENNLAEAVRQLGNRLDQLAATAEPPLFKRHLISVNAIARSEAARAMIYAGSDHKAAEEALGFVTQLIKAYGGAAAQWNTYLEGRRGLVLARLSARDGTLQFSIVRLPADWDPQKAYPLLMNLHGAGPASPLHYVAFISQGATRALWQGPATT